MQSDEPTVRSAFEALSAAKYVSFTTFRRSGVPVATPVWIAPDGDQLVFVSVDDTGKTKRLAHTADVLLQPCDLRGNVAEGAPTYAGRAVVERSGEAMRTARRALAAKYPSARLMNAVHRIVSAIRPTKPRAVIRVTVTDSPRGGEAYDGGVPNPTGK